MTWIATAEECTEMDRQAAEMGITVEMLMREAGRAVARSVLDRFPNADRITAVCGKGNNGGDGFVAAKLLAEHQKQVDVFVAAAESDLNEHAARECARLSEVGIVPRFLPPNWLSLGRADLIVDALLGTGARGAPIGPVRDAIEAINAARVPVVSVDIPSGVACDTGHAEGVAIQAQGTVTFGLAKPFLFQGEGADLSGEWGVAPIGLPEPLLAKSRSALVHDICGAASLMPKRRLSAHKGSEGHVLVVAGHGSMPGAAVLAAYGALRAGAGLVTVASTPEVCRAVSVHVPEAVLLPLPCTGSSLGRAAAEELTPRLSQFDSGVFGPGLSDESEVAAFLSAAWSQWRAPAVLDADALNLIAKGLECPNAPFVLTPHPGEAARLLGCDTAEVQRNRFDAARRLQSKFDQTVLLKGAYSLVAFKAPILVNPTGNPGMASPGMGDVLSGVVGALLAQRLEPPKAAALGAFWHGLAGDICAEEIGPAGYLASEVADALPRARATILSSC